LAAFGWFIAGNVWVFRNYNKVQHTDPFREPYSFCDKRLFLYAFWTIIVTYIFFFVYAIAIIAFFAISKAREDSLVKKVLVHFEKRVDETHEERF
jgi:hypothetical protein